MKVNRKTKIILSVLSAIALIVCLVPAVSFAKEMIDNMVNASEQQAQSQIADIASYSMATPGVEKDGITQITSDESIDLTIHQSVDKKEVLLGDTVTYTIEIENNTTDTIAHNVHVSDTIDKCLEGIPGTQTISDGTYGNVSFDGKELIADIEAIPYGNKQTITFSCKVPENIGNAVSIPNLVHLTADELSDTKTSSISVYVGMENNATYISEQVKENDAVASNNFVSTDSDLIVSAAAEGYLDYDGIVGTVSGQSDIKETSSLTDADGSDSIQHNYTAAESHDETGTTSYLISEAKWTNKAAGEAELTYHAAFANDGEQYNPPLYAFSTCPSDGITTEKVVSNINFMVSRYGTVDCIASISDIGHKWVEHTFSAPTSADELTALGMQVETHTASRTLTLAMAIRNYLFGDYTLPLTSPQVKDPSVIYVSWDTGCGNPILGATGTLYKLKDYVTEDFFQYLADHYRNTEPRRYYSMSHSGGDGSRAHGLNRAMADPNNHEYLLAPEGEGVTFETQMPDYDYTKDFADLGLNIPPQISVEGTVPDFMTITSASGTIDGKPVDIANNSGNKFEVGTYIYTYCKDLTVTVKVKIEGTQGNTWFDTTTAAPKLLSHGEQKLDGIATKLMQQQETPPPAPQPKKDLSIEKTADVSEAKQGDTVNWAITITNTGETATDALVVTDAMPAGISIESTVLDSETTSIETEGNTWTADFTDSPISPGETVSIACATIVDDDAQAGQIENIVSYSDNGIGTGQASDTVDIVLPEEPNVIFTMEFGQEEAAWEEDFDCSVTVENRGVGTAKDLKIEFDETHTLIRIMRTTFQYPETINVNNTNNTNAASPVVIEIPELLSGKLETITFKARVIESDWDPTDSLSAILTGSNIEQQETSDTINVVIPELSVSQSADKTTAEPGDKITFTLDITNITGDRKSFVNNTIVSNLVQEGLTQEGPITIDGIEVSEDGTWSGRVAREEEEYATQEQEVSDDNQGSDSQEGNASETENQEGNEQNNEGQDNTDGEPDVLDDNNENLSEETEQQSLLVDSQLSGSVSNGGDVVEIPDYGPNVDVLNNINIGDTAEKSHQVVFTATVDENTDRDEIKVIGIAHGDFVDRATSEVTIKIVHPTVNVTKAEPVETIAKMGDYLPYVSLLGIICAGLIGIGTYCLKRKK